MSRWFRVQADIFDHPAFAASEMSEREAWLWLIARAAWKDTRHRVGSEMMNVPRGSLFVTLRELQSAWGWASDKRVRGFLLLLESEGMILKKSDAGKTQITICNYCKYQDVGRGEDASGTQAGRNEDALNIPVYQDTKDISSLRSDISREAIPSRKAKKSKLVLEKEMSDAEIVSELSPWLPEETAQALIASRRNLRCKHTAYAVRLLCRDLAKCRDPTAQAERAILNNWKTVYPEKDNATVNGSGQGSAAASGSRSGGNGYGAGGVVAAAQRIIDRLEGEEHVSRQRDGDDREAAGIRYRDGF